jgi:hypothetical protein
MQTQLRFGLALVLVATALGLTEAQFHWWRKLTGEQALDQRALAMQRLGRYLAEHYAGKKAIVLSNPFSQKPGQPSEVYQFEKAGLHGLRRGMGKAVTLQAVVYPALKPDVEQNPASVSIDPTTTTPLSYLITDTALDVLVQAHPDAEIIVSLIGLPVNLRQTKTWKDDSRRTFALLLPDLRMIGNREAISAAIRNGKIAAFVLNKPGAPPEEQPLGRDLEMEFDQRFLLVTRETLERYLKAYPHLF